MTLRISPHSFTESIKYVISRQDRKLNQLLTNVQNPDHAHYKKYSIIRPLISAAHRESDAELNGIRIIVLEHKKLVDEIKVAKKELHEDWQLCDFKIVALQRPGTKPPFFIAEAA